MSFSRPSRMLVVSTLTALGLTLGAGIASAHVSVNPNTAVAGSYTKLTFRVPNESAKAQTVKFTINFPMDHPFASVSVKKEPGWTAVATTTKLTTPVSDDDNADITQAVSSITWTADASGRIALGQFAEFDVSVGPVPKVASMAFAATQTYSDGSVVTWDQPTPASGVEPEKPAPVLIVSAATTAAAAAVTSAAVPTVTAAAIPGTDDTSARVLGVAGIIVGAFGLLVAAVALRRARLTS
ncbi:Uncharacterized protein YcnI [Nakamurella panacisegetis]|uniref:Uncharacterized protein YcnI n=1 Tax=Nakamurella panacisegetis TaxID=1090615 RepID=A0A1H0KAZ8_9ACTN|nr:YcnI family protein [Nakamurella panacisegetis]SDO53003.1 Uncharacterized protein YcnI [Nakamurella panacisegetis]